MLHPTPTPWQPSPSASYRGIITPTMAEAASILLAAYRDAQLIKWPELLQWRLEQPRLAPGPLTGELVVIIAPNAYIVHQVWCGWPGAHVMSIRWQTPAKGGARVAA